MLKRYSIAEARDKFASLVHNLEQEAAIEVTRRGQPVAVLVSIQEYQRLQAQKTGFWDAFINFQTQVDLMKLDIQPEIFTNSRDQSPGREVNW